MTNAIGVAVNGDGNVYISENGGSVLKEDYADAPSLSFVPTVVGSTSTDSPRSVTLENIGNADLTFPVPGTGQNPSIATNFTIDSSATCPVLNTTSSPATLANGASCTLPIDFTPIAPGVISGSLVLTDTNLNASPSTTQTIALSGTAVVITFLPAAGALPAGIAGTAYSQTFTASGGTGPYTFASMGTLPAGLTLSTAGVLSGTPTTAGNYSFSVTATDTNNESSSPQSYTLAVGQGTATVTLGSLTQTYTGSPLSATATTNPTGLTVDFTYKGSPTPPTVVGTYTVVGTINDPNYTGSASATLTINKGTATVTLGSLTQTYTGSPLPATATTTPTGLTVDFTYNGSSTAPTAAGTYTVVGTINDPNYTGSATGTLTVNKANTTLTETSSGPSNVNNPVTFTATIGSSAGTTTLTGTVTFNNGGTAISGCTAVAITPSTGKATCTTSSLVAGTYTVTATYTGDTNFSGSSGTVSQTVNAAASTTTLTASPNPSVVNQSVTFTANVTPFNSAVSLSGMVAFTEDGTTIAGCGAVAINPANGQATCTASSLAGGSHSIVASYSNDPSYSGSSGTVSQTVNAAASTTTLTASPNPSTLNQSVTFTAIVTPFNSTVKLSGTVAFTVNGTAITGCSAAAINAANGQATCTTSSLTVGSHSIVATYSNDSSYSSSSGTVAQTVNAAASTTVLTASPNPSTVNQSVTFTASVTPFNSTVKLSGTVAFTDNGTTIAGCGAVAVNASTGVATCTTPSLPVGADAIVATYAGDTNYSTSSSSLTQQVGQATTSLALISSLNPSTINQAVTFTATITAASGPTALAGMVTFTDNGNPIVGCQAVSISGSSSTATCTTSSLASGTNAIVATYGSDPNFSGSTATLSQTVNSTTTSLALTSSVDPSAVNQAVQFTATVTGASGANKLSGTVNFTDNGSLIAGCSIAVNPTTGVAVCTTSALTKGSHTIAATYANDPNYGTSSGSLTQTVNAAASTTALVSSLNPSVVQNPQNYNDLVALTATVSPASGPVLLSGAVTFTDNGGSIAECQAPVPVNPSTGVAACATTSLSSGTHAILATYNGDPNFTSSGGSITQEVQDYALATSQTSAISVTQGYTNNSDPFTPQSVTVSASPVAGFTGSLALSCNVVPVTAASGAVAPLCTPGSSTLAIVSGTTPQPVSVTIDAGSGSTPVASPGTYSVTLMSVDSATGLTHTTTSFLVNVRYEAAPINLVSGATTGNTSSVDFTLPANVGISVFQCSSVVGSNLQSSVSPATLFIGCGFNPSSVSASSSPQSSSVTVTINTGTTTTAKLDDDQRTTIVLAGLLGVPLLALLGFMPGGKSSRKIFFRFLGIALVAVLLLQGTGCGGPSSSSSGGGSNPNQTPAGSYSILVQGTGSDNQAYQAVVQVNVTQ